MRRAALLGLVVARTGRCGGRFAHAGAFALFLRLQRTQRDEGQRRYQNDQPQVREPPSPSGVEVQAPASHARGLKAR